MSWMLKELLEYLAKSLVDNPEAVHVEAMETETTVVLELTVAKDDVGKVIGKQGRIARALRTIVKASAVRDGKRAINLVGGPSTVIDGKSAAVQRPSFLQYSLDGDKLMIDLPLEQWLLKPAVRVRFMCNE